MEMPSTPGQRHLDTNGWILFAFYMLLFTGIWNAVEGFFGFFRATWFIGHPLYGSLWAWAIAWLCFGLIQIGAAFAIISGQQWGRWFAIVIVAINALLNLFLIGTYPFWSIVVLAVDFAIIYALTVQWRTMSQA